MKRRLHCLLSLATWFVSLAPTPGAERPEKMINQAKEVLAPLDGDIGRQVRHQQVLADRGAGSGACHVRRPTLRVHEPRTVECQDRLAAFLGRYLPRFLSL